MTKKPIFIGIAGDSASGKHTFFGFVRDILGRDNISIINGDDYHRWPRRHPKWKELTHLHPDGNDLDLLLEHAQALSRGETISKSIYDHDKGDFIDWEEVRSKKFIAFVGLHALFLERMRALMDLSFFMFPDEELRRYWKIRRDQTRGYTKAEIIQNIQRRLPDAEKYINPQRDRAHAVLHYYSTKRGADEAEDRDVDLGVKLFQRGVVDLSPLLTSLLSCDTLKVTCTDIPNPGERVVDVSGTISAKRIEEIADTYFASYLPATSGKKRWRGNTQGICQLVFLQNLCQLDQYQDRVESRQRNTFKLEKAE